MENLELYNRFADVPENAKSKIEGGKLKGKSDINPMWRIKCLTEAFGPCGIGWYTKITEHWTEEAVVDFIPASNHEVKESTAWVTIELYVKNPETGEWSMPIVGTGGSKQCGKGMGDGINDEAFKMAETDAISVACKKLGMGANVYWNVYDTKYSAATKKMAQTAPATQPAPTTTATAPKKPLIEEGNALWTKAIAYCVANNVKAEALQSSYTLTAETVTKLQAAIDKATA